MGILPIPYVNYENPSWLVSLAATKITGAFGAATFTGPANFVDSGGGSCRIDGRYITFPGTDGYISGSGRINIEDGLSVNGSVVEFAGITWHKGAGNQRFYFGYDSTTYLQGHGSTPFILRNGSDENIVTISSTGGATFGGVVTVNGLTLPGQNAYMMRLTCTGDRAFKWEGEASGSDYTTTFSNAGAGKHNITVSGGATFNGAIGFKEGVWNISNADSARRLFFQNNSTTYIAGNGSNPVQLRNASEQSLVSFNSNFETVFHSTGGGSAGVIIAGAANFNGSVKIGTKTIATLPSAASSVGERYQVSDSATIANRIAFSNGSAWYYEGTAVAV